MTSVGLINPFEKFRKVLIFFFTAFLELCSNAFALVPPFKNLQRFMNRGCSSKGILPSLGSQFGSAVDATKWTSGLEDPSYKGRFKLKIQLKSEKPSWRSFVFHPLYEITVMKTALPWEWLLGALLGHRW